MLINTKSEYLRTPQRDRRKEILVVEQQNIYVNCTLPHIELHFTHSLSYSVSYF